MKSELSTYKAFTLVEVILITFIMAIMAVTGSSALLNYHRTSVMDAELRTITARLQRARQIAISNDNGSVWSVKFLNDRYVLYEGSTYSGSNPTNDSHFLDSSVLLSSTFVNDNITFDNFTGRTGVQGSITFSAFGLTKTVTINALGIVEDIT